jgi:hypothetical protein
VETKPFHPVSELVQLCYVLPKHSLHLLPQPLHSALISKHARWYSDKCEFVWAYCQYFWEAHVEMSDIDIQELEIIVSTFIKTRIDM